MTQSAGLSDVECCLLLVFSLSYPASESIAYLEEIKKPAADEPVDEFGEAVHSRLLFGSVGSSAVILRL